MPTYKFFCPKCKDVKEKFCSITNRPKPPYCEECELDMKMAFAHGGTKIKDGGTYGKTKYSDALAIMPSQVEEHKKLFPDVKLDSQCRPGFSNYKQHDKYLEKIGAEKVTQKIKRKGKRIA